MKSIDVSFDGNSIFPEQVSDIPLKEERKPKGVIKNLSIERISEED